MIISIVPVIVYHRTGYRRSPKSMEIAGETVAVICSLLFSGCAEDIGGCENMRDILEKDKIFSEYFKGYYHEDGKFDWKLFEDDSYFWYLNPKHIKEVSI